MTKHDLKCAPEHFQALWDGVKTAELRKDDRGFAVGDVVVLREWDAAVATDAWLQWMDAHPDSHFADQDVSDARQMAIDAGYTGRTDRSLITHILRGGPWLCDGYVMLSLGDAS